VGFGDSDLQVGQSAFLWDLFTEPTMLYGAEVWTCNSETALLDPKKFQIQDAQKVFGKRAMSTVTGEAAFGDLGWTSVRSKILEIKLRFYGYLCRLPETRLAKQVFLLRKLEYTNLDGLPNLNTPDKTKSWFHDIQNGLELLKLLPIYANTQAVRAHSKSQWNKLVHKIVLEIDENQLFQNMPRTDSGKYYSHIKTQYGQKAYIFAHDRRSTMLKFYLRLRSFGFRARMFHGEQQSMNKQCKQCPQGVEENEEHYLLDCPTFFPERAEFARLLLLDMQAEFGQELTEIRTASKSEQVAYILGRTEPH
jgi:hypothetical protein